MINLDITLNDVLEEYDKYIISTLINKEYDFTVLRQKVKNFDSKFNLFNYNDNISDIELIKNIQKQINSINSENISKDFI